MSPNKDPTKRVSQNFPNVFQSMRLPAKSFGDFEVDNWTKLDLTRCSLVYIAYSLQKEILQEMFLNIMIIAKLRHNRATTGR